MGRRLSTPSSQDRRSSLTCRLLPIGSQPTLVGVVPREIRGQVNAYDGEAAQSSHVKRYELRPFDRRVQQGRDDRRQSTSQYPGELVAQGDSAVAHACFEESGHETRHRAVSRGVADAEAHHQGEPDEDAHLCVEQPEERKGEQSQEYRAPDKDLTLAETIG